MPAKRTKVECRCAQCDVAFLVKPSDILKGGGRFCSCRCRYAYAHRPEVTVARFFEKVRKDTAPNACWIWTGAIFAETQPGRGGYGKFSLGGQVMTASKASWIIHAGAVPDGQFVCHNCPGGDDRKCVRPDHLFLGTAKENSEDMVKKGRSATGDRNGSRTHPERYPTKALSSSSRSLISVSNTR